VKKRVVERVLFAAMRYDIVLRRHLVGGLFSDQSQGQTFTFYSDGLSFVLWLGLSAHLELKCRVIECSLWNICPRCTSDRLVHRALPDFTDERVVCQRQ